MGAQSSSHFKSITNIHQQLLNIEATLSNAEASDLWRRMQIREGMAAGATSYVRKDDVFLYGTHLACRPGVRVTCGPVVGRVTETEAKVLVEINSTVEVTCYVAIFDDELPSGRMVKRQAKLLTAGQPEVFHIGGLTPGQRYNVCFGGVCADDAVQRVATFRAGGGGLRQRFRLALVSNNRRDDCVRGEENLWETLALEVTDPKARVPVELVLHLGSQAFPAAGDVTGDWAGLRDLMQRRAAERMRWSWNFPHTRAVLGACANLCVCGAGERGLGRAVFEAYQDALTRDAPGPAPATLAESKLAGAAGKRPDDFSSESFHFIQKVGCLAFVNLELQGGRQAFAGEAPVPNRSLLPPAQWEALEELLADDGVKGLVVSTESPLVYLTPAEVQQCGVLAKAAFYASPGSPKAMEWEDTMAALHRGWCAAEHEKSLHRLLGFLFAWKAAAPGRDCVVAAGGVGAAAETEVHDAKTGQTIRQVCVGSVTQRPEPFLPAASGQLGGYGKRFRFLHRPVGEGRKSFATMTFANTGDNVWPLWEGVRIDVDFVLANDRVPTPRGVCGPIVGEVTSSSAVVLLEIDRDAAVRCTLRNSLDGTKVEQVQSLRGGAVHAFKFEGLYPQRRYDVLFEGLADAIDRTGTVQTHAVDPATPFTMVLVNRNDPRAGIKMAQRDRHLAAAAAAAGGGSGGKKKKKTTPTPTPWELLKYKFQVPWATPHVVLHTGGQVQIDRQLLSPAAQATQAEFTNMPPEERAAARRRIYDIVADGYRSNWDILSSTRRVLGICPNVMMCGPGDVGVGYGMPRGGQAAVLTQEARRAYARYQRQLWDAYLSQRGDSGGGGGGGGVQRSEGHVHQFGAVAVFCFDLRAHRVDADGVHCRDAPFVDAAQWASLERVLGLPSVRTLVLVSESPFVKDSPGDARVKDALDPSLAYIRQTWPYNATHLQRLLELVFAWKKAGARREAVLVANCDGVGDSGVETVIADSTADGLRVTQYLLPALVVDPAVASAGFVCEREGGLFDRFTYSHTVTTRRPGIACLRLTPVPTQRDTVKMELAVSAATPIGDRPKWVDALLDETTESAEEQELAFKVRGRIDTEALAAAADGSSPLLRPGERCALDELRHGWAKGNRVGQWRKALAVLFHKGCSGLVRRGVLFPSDDVIHAVHARRAGNYPGDLDLDVAAFVGQASDMFAKQAVVAHRLKRLEAERRKRVDVPAAPDADENAVNLAV